MNKAKIKEKLTNSKGKLRSSYNIILNETEKEFIKNLLPECEDFATAIKIFFTYGEYKKCEICNSNITKWSVRNTCSKKCMLELKKSTNLEKYGTTSPLSSKEIRDKIKSTNIEKYGVEVASKAEDVKDRIKQTNLQRYGVTSTLLTDEVIQKTEQTNLEKYGSKVYTSSQDFKDKVKLNLEQKGVENVSQLDYVQDKIKQTNLQRYGFESTLSSKEIRDKIKQTNLRRYGFENPIQSEVVYNKIKQTNIEKYGVENVSQLDYVQDKIKQTNIEKYGVENIFKSDHFKDKYYTDLYNMIFNKLDLSLDLEVIKKLNISPYKDYSKELLVNIIDYYVNGELPSLEILKSEYSQTSYNSIARKFGYNIKPTQSSFEFILREFLDELNVNYIVSTKKIIAPYELDIFIPEHNIAIEFNGSYWHSDKFKDKKYHQMKTKLCNEKGITLIHIHEHLFNKKAEIYKAIIKSKLQLNERVYARKCVLKEVPKQEEKDFLNKYHLQGFIGSSKCYGLYYNDDLLILCSFGKSRFNKKYEYELLRNCSKPGITVVGGLTKIIKQYKSEIDFKDIICYNDASISYNKNNILTEPNYVWIKNDIVLSRYQTMKHKLFKVLGNKYNDNLSESENLRNNGFCKIFDSGNYITII